MIRLVRIIILALVLPATAHAQTAYAPDRSDVVRRVAAACPGLIYDDHRFTGAVASVLYAEDARWGRNGKRGNPNDLSHDAIAYRTSASPLGVAIIDIIGAAGSASASPAWIDQTDETIRVGTTGVWVQPSGVLPACLTGTTPAPVPDPGTPPTPVPDPPPTTDLSEVLSALQRIEARLGALEARTPTLPPVVSAYVDAMVGSGPAGDPATVPNHITDILQRIDANRSLLEQLSAWLRGRGLLRYE